MTDANAGGKNIRLNYIYEGDALEVLKTFPDECIDMVITSPPYWGLRDYGIDGQIGLEDTIEEHIKTLVEIFDECKRVLKRQGTLWVNYGDKYVNKSMQLVPERLAIALVDSGWILRNKIIWHKRDIVPQTVRDRFTHDWEYVYFFVKSPKDYYFEQQFESALSDPHSTKKFKPRDKYKGLDKVGEVAFAGLHEYFKKNGMYMPTKRNRRSVWSIASQSVSEAHFATFPFALISTPIRASCPKGGVVLDLFMGSGTTAIVARALGRNYVGIELNPEYIKIAEKRLTEWPPERVIEKLNNNSDTMITTCRSVI